MNRHAKYWLIGAVAAAVLCVRAGNGSVEIAKPCDEGDPRVLVDGTLKRFRELQMSDIKGVAIMTSCIGRIGRLRVHVHTGSAASRKRGSTGRCGKRKNSRSFSGCFSYESAWAVCSGGSSLKGMGSDGGQANSPRGRASHTTSCQRPSL